MDHFRNFLSGVGQVLAAFGAAPAYRYPTAGDHARDLELIGGDMGAVGRDMTRPALVSAFVIGAKRRPPAQ
jgi:hypothetical protein